MRRLIILIVTILLVIGTVFVWWQRGVTAVNTKDTSKKIIVVQKGKSIRELANQLKQEDLIRDPVVFFLLVKQLGLDNKIQAGSFRLSPSQSAKEIAESLTHGTLDIWVTIPEGKRVEEVAAILKTTVPNYKDAWEDALKSHEGYLFPDTYLMPREADITLIISISKNTFEKKYQEIEAKKTSKLPKEDIVKIASLIEREVRFQEDRPLVASVIYNRLEIGMPIQIDATIQYALGYQAKEKSWWKRALTFDDLKIKSNYNSYTTTGLPPTPIASPGYAALEAAANPAKTEYLYYLSDSSGRNHYSKTVEGHNANIKKYL